ncbi:hypothetical protein RU96_GL002326 [Enterococcus canintestini]|uniref:Uncharacterized protein n=1 Tax=Enterococcus canintestini TaxID=317010 RepID=A0A1L8R6Y4_9ENTE|nr:hypothetical protein RU96_GL002326 [Enterococcus canintestini]
MVFSQFFPFLTDSLHTITDLLSIFQPGLVFFKERKEIKKVKRLILSKRKNMFE